ncbi:hypothetical protein DPMN_133466 [Dreissena polymorpha]|uniref:G-protein coupled receptors family 1 profile domain-containing protein n=1 Tax=Dreissena polymorpha TaxID=45954 RepID=A0A9D4FYF1_DREPO|nr:hypothetical protein DPMN_133466 [Dreissena polymorpha]
MDKMQTNITTLENETLPQNFTNIPQFDETLARVELFSVPVIAVFGIIGNAFSCAIFSTKPLNKYSSSFLLLCRSLSDIGFLTVLLIHWASSVFDFHLNEMYRACQIFVSLTYVFACLSVWLVTLFASENCLRLYTTFYTKKICKRRNAKVITACMTIAIGCFYSYPFWTVGKDCIPMENYHGLIKAMAHVDSALTMFVPSTIMILTLIASALISFSKSRERRRKRSASSTTSKDLLRQATLMVFVVTLTFILLNLPAHASRIRLIHMHAMVGTQLSKTKSVFQAIAQLIFYLSPAINFVIYYAFGRKFRVSFNETVLRKRTRRHDNTALNANCKPPGQLLIKQMKFIACNGNNVTVMYYPVKDV